MLPSREETHHACPLLVALSRAGRASTFFQAHPTISSAVYLQLHEQNPQNTAVHTKLNLLRDQLLRNENREVLPGSRRTVLATTLVYVKAVQM